MPFIPGLQLARMLYEDEIAPALARRFPALPYAAATLGMCSEVLGLDDEVSMDHEWGPRVTIFLSDADHARYAEEVMAALREALPATFKGLNMAWRTPGVDVHDTREAILYHVRASAVARTLKGYSIAALPLTDVEWLGVSEQHLCEFTAGVVYRDDLGELGRARELLRYYPDNVLRYLLMSEWGALNGDWWPIGRIGPRGDRLGLRVQAAAVVERLMRLAFMVCQRYMPYKKWFGSLFRSLPVAAALEPLLLELLSAEDWRRVEELICTAASIVLQQQISLGFAPPLDLQPEIIHDGRHHIKLNYSLIYHKLEEGLTPELKAIVDNQLFWLHERRLILWNGEVGKWAMLLQK
jgi:hypothetical protein